MIGPLTYVILLNPHRSPVKQILSTHSTEEKSKAQRLKSFLEVTELLYGEAGLSSPGLCNSGFSDFFPIRAFRNHITWLAHRENAVGLCNEQLCRKTPLSWPHLPPATWVLLSWWYCTIIVNKVLNRGRKEAVMG